MRNLNLFLPNGETVVYLDEPIKNPSTITLRHATVFWDFENITSENNSVTYGTKKITFEFGYWDFESLRERLSSENVTLTRKVPSRKCTVTSKGKALNLKKFGKLLGFPENTTIQKDVTTESPNPVDILCGLRFLQIWSDIVEPNESTDTDGRKSQTLVCLPVVSYEPLNSSVKEYMDVNSVAMTTSSTVASIRFGVDSNIDSDPEVYGNVKVKVLVSLVVR